MLVKCTALLKNSCFALEQLWLETESGVFCYYPCTTQETIFSLWSVIMSTRFPACPRAALYSSEAQILKQDIAGIQLCQDSRRNSTLESHQIVSLFHLFHQLTVSFELMEPKCCVSHTSVKAQQRMPFVPCCKQD